MDGTAIGRRSGYRPVGCTLAWTLVFLGVGVGGCVGLGTRGDLPAIERSAPSHGVTFSFATQPLRFYVPDLVNADLPAEADARQALLRNYTWRAEPETPWEGGYTIRSLCIEVERATGKRLMWIPAEEGDALLAMYGDSSTVVEPLSTGPAENTPFGRSCRRCLGAVLSHLVASVSRDTWGPDGKPALWVAVVARDWIYLIRLPRAVRGEEAGRPPRLTPGADPKAQPIEEAFDASTPTFGLLTVDVPAVVPHDWEKPSLAAALLSPKEEARWLDRDVPISGAKLDVLALARMLGHQAGLSVRWYPDPVRSQEHQPGASGGLKIVRLPSDTDAERARIPVLYREGRAPPGTALGAGTLLQMVLSKATRFGVAIRLPDREVWTALRTRDSLILMALPDEVWR